MTNGISKAQIIDYPPEKLRSFYKTGFEWIDNLNFALKPEDCVENSEEYIVIAKELFTEMGWYGDGEVQLMWIPPFMFDGVRSGRFTLGIVFWHVKQEEDGISWILSPIDFYNFEKPRIIFNEDTEELRQYSIEIAKKYNKIMYEVI